MQVIFVPDNMVELYRVHEKYSKEANKIYPIGGSEWQAEFGSSDEYADIDKYVEDPAERERIKEAYRNA